MNPSRSGNKLDGLYIALAMSFAFMALSFLRTIGDASSASFGRGVLQSVLAQPIWGTRLGTELTQFVGALVLIHALAAVVSWVLARLTLCARPQIGSSQRVLTVFWLVLAMIWVLVANAYWYPRSALGEHYSALVSASIAGISLFAFLSTLMGLVVAAILLTVCIRHYAVLARSRLAWAGGLAFVVAGVALPSIDGLGNARGSDGDDRPHVIFIGIDSLRTDFVQNTEHQWTPALDSFLGDSIQFSNTVTPLARTFPAWVSIVTGQHPHTTGAFVNLLPRDEVEIGNTLPSILSGEGYETVYAIDEVRFSNLDETYGFDKMLAPPMGAADFMLGFFSDTPLANIVSNTIFGRWLFPYGYSNRAADKTYDPDTFLDWVDDGVSFDRPTFLSAHLTLAHWPYTWATAPDPRDPSSVSVTKDASNRGLYEVAVDRVDRQFGQLMSLLEKKGALENAIVVVLSDHGESLGESSPLIGGEDSEDSMELPFPTLRLFGHGTHVFSRDQYNVVMGFRSYGSDLLETDEGGVLSIPATLEDLAPTMLDLLGTSSGGQAFDGQSLAPYLRNDEPLLFGHDERIRFLETEFNPPGIEATGMPSESALMSAANTYEIDPETDRVMIRTEFVGDILAKRQYAAELDGRILAAVPGERLEEQFLLYFDPEGDGLEWLDRRPSATDDEDVYRLWIALEQRFSPARERDVMAQPVVVNEEP